MLDIDLPHSFCHCYRRLAAQARPRDRLTVSGWSDRHRMLSSKDSHEVGRFRSQRHPMLVEIMDSLSAHSSVREVTLVFPAQFGKTIITTNWIGYTMHHAPCPMLGLMPSLESRDDWKLQKLNPMMAETLAIRDLLGGLKSRDAANSKNAVEFPGGVLFLGGGNSPNSYAQRSAKSGFVDDLDRFPWEVGKEGSPVQLMRGRFEGFPNYKFLKISTPTVEGASLILLEYEQSDQRRYHVPCPACGERQHLRWKNMKWDQTHSHPAWAEYECEHCGHGIKHHHKPQMLADGVWVPAHPEIRLHRGYHANRLYAPIGLGSSWTDMAARFLAVKNDPTTLKTFINTQLAEGWKTTVSKLASHDLAKRAEAYDLRQIPPGVLAITCSVDTQDEWLAVKLLGWGAPLHPDGPPRHWLLDWDEIRLAQKNTTHTEVWDELEKYLHLPLVNAWGRPMKIEAVAIDSRGHRSKEVRDFVMRDSLRVPVYAVQGATNRMNRPIAQNASDQDKKRNGQALKTGYGLWNVGTEHAKDYIYGRLAADGEVPPEDRIFHFPSGLPLDYYHGLLSEVFDPDKGRYVQKAGAQYKRNEPIDTMGYAWAIGHHKHVLIGLRNTRAGFKPNPAYWTRRAVELERDLAPAPQQGAGAAPAAHGEAPRVERAPRPKHHDTGDWDFERRT